MAGQWITSASIASPGLGGLCRGLTIRDRAHSQTGGFLLLQACPGSPTSPSCLCNRDHWIAFMEYSFPFRMDSWSCNYRMLKFNLAKYLCSHFYPSYNSSYYHIFISNTSRINKKPYLDSKCFLKSCSPILMNGTCS